MNKYELDKAEQMFVTGMLTRGSVPVGADGDGLVDEVASAIRALRRGWKDGWADVYADALSPMSDEELKKLNKAAADPSMVKPATGVARKPVSADMSDFFEWSGDPLGIGKKRCETWDKPWAEVTFEEISQIHPGQKSDIGYLRWITGPKFEAKTQAARKTKARVAALLEQITDSAPAPPPSEPTPF
jgi:hypothetical protein